MQHDNITKKLTFDLFTASPGLGRMEGLSVGKIFDTMLLHSRFPLIWYATWPRSEPSEFCPIDCISRVGAVGGSVGKIFSTMLLHSWFPFWYATRPCSEKVEFWPHFLSLGEVCRQNSCYHVAAFRDSFQFDMQHDHVLKKLNFDPLTLPQGVEGLCAKCLLPCCCSSRFYLLWYATWPCSEKAKFWPIDPSGSWEGRG